MADDDVELYARTYTTLLRSRSDVRVQAFVPAHIRMGSSLHALADQPVPDAGAFIYAMQRLPECVAQVERVVLGQEGDQFRAVLGEQVDRWSRVEARARRRAWRWDGNHTLTVHVSSPSDLDDVLPCLVAYQAEWNKLHTALKVHQRNHHVAKILSSPEHGNGDRIAESLRELGNVLHIGTDDWDRLSSILGTGLVAWIHRVAQAEKDITVRLLGGFDVAYTRLVRRWWNPVGDVLSQRGIEGRPLYFVSSNLHAIVNLLSGYVKRRRQTLWEFVDQATSASDVHSEVAELRSLKGLSNAENILYYASRLWHRADRNPKIREVRRLEEASRGITQVDASGGFEVGAQVIELKCIQAADLDPRLARFASVLERSDAVVLNVDYPLGLASYHIVREVATVTPDLRAIYAVGKAATLNAAFGDVMLSETVFDEHSRNTYAFPNAFTAAAVATFLERGSALDNQTAVTVRGTFLQNFASLERYYRDRHTVVEMEAGPILSAVFEATRPQRHPTGERVYFRELPFDFGIIHYASDTPYTQARTLGSRGLSVEGVDATYASALAVVTRILTVEAQRLGLSIAP
ncbi:MAG: hypothetical protein EXR45_03980 [Chloroflexi bacterium]|nr:hypothetical protein [Chloroflexota bacterium]